MKPKEDYETRLNMAKMHDDVLKRIDNAYKDEKYIEVCWLCYACFESRVNRVLDKICSGCSKQERKDNRHVGIKTKLECYVRLVKRKYPPLQNEDVNLIQTVKGWCKERNSLIHGMVSLEYYNDADEKFKSLAKRGKNLVKRMYDLGKDVREYYYRESEIPGFPSDAVQYCPLEYKCVRQKSV